MSSVRHGWVGRHVLQCESNRYDDIYLAKLLIEYKVNLKYVSHLSRH